MISAKQRDRLYETINRPERAGGEVLAGGAPSSAPATSSSPP